jgi:alkylhydroperoxidase family enzyme
MNKVRIPPLPPAERDQLAEELLASVRTPEGEDLNIFATLVRHPKLMRKWLPFGGALLYRGVLSPRHRELLVLRTAWRCHADYEWGHHVEIAESVGFTSEEIEAITADDLTIHGWSELELALLRAADELHERSRISEPVWGRLAEDLDEPSLIEICYLVGNYHVVAFLLNSLGIQPEKGH